MGKFTKKKGKGSDELNTASLPDIVFMLLFFFMVVTTLKDKEPLVQIKLPKSSEIAKIEARTLIKYINIGPPAKGAKVRGTAPRIQMNDAFVTTDDIQTEIDNWKKTMPDKDRKKLIVSMKVDKETKMGIVTSVKEELRKANARKLLYAVTETERSSNQ